MLQLIGLGLADEKDVSVKGLELIKKAERVYLEAYTSILLVDSSKLVSPPFLSHSSKYRTKTDQILTVGSLLWPLCHCCRP